MGGTISQNQLPQSTRENNYREYIPPTIRFSKFAATLIDNLLCKRSENL